MSIKYKISTFILLGGILAPLTGVYASDIKVSGWVPYWAAEKGTASAIKHIDSLDTIHPFTYTIKEDGTLYANADLKKGFWDDMLDEAKDEKVEVIPTIMNGSGDFMHKLLSDEDSMEDHVDEIVKMVKRGRYAGVDIDYEGKKADTREYFADFLKELDRELGSSKKLVCTIEARTPPDSLYKVVPTNLEYANDYEAISKHCDRVNIMTYDQGRADILLNDSKRGTPYIPVADKDWVEKVIKLALEEIPEEKIMLGVATYGHEYNVTVAPNWFKEYKKLWSISPDYGTTSATNLGLTPYRTKSGEMALSYPNSGTPVFDKSITAPSGTPKGEEVALKALDYANKTGKTATFNLIWWSDAQAIQDKIDLAEKYNLRGIAIFKIDGDEDQGIWEKF